MKFTKEQMEEIDRILEEADKEKETYSYEEFWGDILGEENYKLLHRFE